MTTQNTRSASPLSARPSLRYRTVDLLVVVLIGVVAGVAFASYAALILMLKPLTLAFPPSEGLFAGFWALPGALSMLIVRKPGAALGAMWIGATIEAMLGSHFGLIVLFSGSVVASGFEIAFLLHRYRRPTWATVALGAFLSMCFEWVWEIIYYFPQWSWSYKFVLLALFWVSGAVLLAVPAKRLSEALARTGALNAFALGKERPHSRDA